MTQAVFTDVKNSDICRWLKIPFNWIRTKQRSYMLERVTVSTVYLCCNCLNISRCRQSMRWQSKPFLSVTSPPCFFRPARYQVHPEGKWSSFYRRSFQWQPCPRQSLQHQSWRTRTGWRSWHGVCLRTGTGGRNYRYTWKINTLKLLNFKALIEKPGRF